MLEQPSTQLSLLKFNDSYNWPVTVFAHADQYMHPY